MGWFKPALGSLYALAALLCAAGGVRAADETADAFFEKRIRPVLVQRCYECHSAESKKSKGGLLVDSRAGLLAGGNTGPAVVPGNLEKSTLIHAIRYKDEDMQMPPKNRLTPEQVADFETWIQHGAHDPRGGRETDAQRQRMTVEKARDYWSFKPIQPPAPPEVRDSAWPLSPVDRFVLAKLEDRGLKPVADAPRQALIRRATFDLTGLPPTPEEVKAFVDDPAPLQQAFAALIDRLLASHTYGERWGRHWMDLVRYADTAGDNSDYPIPQAHLYRDYIIAAFNADKPYDRFVREQIAGDLLPYETWEQRNQQVIATGYIASSRRFGSVVDRYPQHLTIDDTLDNMGKVFLGLSLSCARCHDHKFDPISKEDYFALYGFFQSTKYAFPGIELLKIQKDFVPLLPQEEVDKILGPYREQERELAAAHKKLQDENKAAEKEKEKLQAQVAKAPKEEQAKMTARIAELETQIDALRKPIADAAKKVEELKRKAPKIPNAYAVSEGKPSDAHVHLRGEPDKPGALIPRRFLEVLGGQTLPAAVGAKGSGRAQLAEWITSPNNPLFARVMINRLWQHHFGRGLVTTPSDFGSRGAAPTHPELLDWLANRFVEGGYSLKQMHRQLMLSRVYQLAAVDDTKNAAADADNTLLWRRKRARLDVESIRDTLLALSGKLDRTPPAGPHPFPPQEKWGFTQHYPFKDFYPTQKRGVYMLTRRLNALPFMTAFDGADANAITAQRDSSVTTVQALFWLNDPMFHENAQGFAARIMKEATGDTPRLERAFSLALGRSPSADERQACANFIQEMRKQTAAKILAEDAREKQVWESVARSVLRLNEFIYVD